MAAIVPLIVMSTIPVGTVPVGTTTVVVAMKLKGVARSWPYFVNVASAPSAFMTSPLVVVFAGIAGTVPNFVAFGSLALVTPSGAR